MNLLETVTTTDSTAVFLMEDATQLAVSGQNAALNSQSQIGICLAVLTPTAAAHTYKVQVARTAGTGSVTVSASATNPAFVLAIDIGT
jgi:hypothetical protein